MHETHDVPLPAQCPTCGEPVAETQVAAQYQEDLPPVQPVVRRFDVHIGTCTGCQRRVQARHPLQTSDALGAAAVQLGPHAIALAVQLNKQFGVSFGKIATLFRERFGLRVTASAIVRALHRVAAKGQPTYDALCETVRTSPVVVPDETGWKARGLLHWLWVFATAMTTVYRICPGRGFADAATVLGADFAVGLSRDGWRPTGNSSRRSIRVAWVTFSDGVGSCAAILRAPDSQRGSHGSCRRPSACATGTRPGWCPRMASTWRAVICSTSYSRPSKTSAPDVQLLCEAFADGASGPVQFPRRSRARATNWRAEQAIRPAVVTRKMCGGGNRSPQGAETQQILASLLRTAHQRSLDADDIVTTLLQARAPIVAPTILPGKSISQLTR